MRAIDNSGNVLTPEELRAFGLRPIMGGDGEGDPPADQKPAAGFVPSEEFKAFQEVIGGAIRGMADNIANLAETMKPRPVVDATAGVKDEEIEAALAQGTGATVFRRLVDEGVERRLAKDVAPQMQAGLEAIQRMAKDNALSARDSDGRPVLPYYTEYKDEIEGVLAQLPAGTKITAESYRWAHDLVAGRHVTEITARAVEAANRKAAGTPPPTSGALRNTREVKSDANTIPTVEEFLGAEAATTLEQMGRTPDQHAQNLGYEDWSDYVTKARELDATVNAGAGGGGRKRGR